jgi:hypothetical protein
MKSIPERAVAENPEKTPSVKKACSNVKLDIIDDVPSDD